MIRVDLHTHSLASPDGGLSEKDYFQAFKYSDLDLIAVTDHGSLDFAKYLKNHEVIGKTIIVGAEISSSEGDIIGLYIDELPEAGMTAAETAKHIRKQGGLVVIPHPEDGKRSSVGLETMKNMPKLIDAIESFNGRRFSHKNLDELRRWALEKHIPLIATSDAHSKSGIGSTYTVIPSLPAGARDLKTMLKDTTDLHYRRAPIRALLAPKLNRIKKLMLFHKP